MNISEPLETPWLSVAALLKRQIQHYEQLLPLMIQPHDCSPKRTRERYEQDYKNKTLILEHFRYVLEEIEHSNVAALLKET